MVETWDEPHPPGVELLSRSVCLYTGTLLLSLVSPAVVWAYRVASILLSSREVPRLPPAGRVDYTFCAWRWDSHHTNKFVRSF